MCDNSLTLTFSPASAASPSPRSGRASARSRLPRSSPTPAACSPSDSQACPTAATCDNGQISLTLPDESASSPEGIHASRFHSPGSAEARATTATSGRQCASLSRDSGPLGSLVRTLLGTSRWGSTLCWLTWKASVTPRGRLLFQLAPSMPDTAETACGLWPTARTKGLDGGSNSRKAAKERGLWPTPRAHEAGDWQQDQSGVKRATLTGAVRLFPTPTTTPYGSNQSPSSGAAVRPSLESLVRLWPTPCASEARQGYQNRNNGKRGQQESLSTVIQGGPAATVGGSLNPTWVEWLMGYPLSWTALAEYPSQPRQRHTLKNPKQDAATVCAGSATPSSRKSPRSSSKPSRTLNARKEESLEFA